MLHFLIMGIVLGLSAGFAPGPLLTLVIAETLEHGIGAGIKVAMVPILTDLPIILVTVVALVRLAQFHAVLGMLSLVGGFFVLFLGIRSIRTPKDRLPLPGPPVGSWTKGLLANVFSPHPYLFWCSVGAPTVTNALGQSGLAAVAFVLGFYVFLVGSKIGIALGVHRARSWLTGRWYRSVLRLLGMILCGLALILLRDGLQLLQRV